MAGTVSLAAQTFSSMKKYAVTWTSTTGGAATYTTTAAFDGLIHRIVVDPSTAAAPSTDYDVTLTDGNGVDVLGGVLVGLNGASAAQQIILGTTGNAAPTAVSSVLDFAVSGAGNAKSGEVIFYVR